MRSARSVARDPAGSPSHFVEHLARLIVRMRARMDVVESGRLVDPHADGVRGHLSPRRYG